MLKRILTFSILTALMLSGCAGKNGNKTDETKILSGNDYIVVSDESLASTADTISGEGEIAFKDPVGAISSNKNFQIDFQLADGSSAELKTYCDKNSSDCVRLGFSRIDNLVSLSAATGNSEPIEFELDQVNASGLISLSIDVHNTETPAHILVWNQSEQSPSDDNAWFNSDADGAVAGNGNGMFWGLAIKDAKVSKATIGSPEFAH
jgi:hypothetical protein